MLFLLSPAKSLDYETPAGDVAHSEPLYVPQAAELIDILQEKSPQQIAELMSLSNKLAGLNAGWGRTGRLVTALNQRVPQGQQVQLLPCFKAHGVDRVALVATAGDVLLMQVRQRKQWAIRHGASSSGAHSHGIQTIVLIVVVLVSIVGIEVPRVTRIGRVLRTGPIVVGLQPNPPTYPGFIVC